MYEIKKTVEERRKNKYIILTHVRNFYEANTFLSPEVLIGTYRYSWGKLMHYFMVELQSGIRRERDGLPIHFGVELIDKDYAIMVGQPLVTPSYWVRRLAEQAVIPYEMRDAVVICLLEDFSIDIPDDRMLRMLAHQLLTPLMTILDIPQQRILYIDSIVDWSLLNQSVIKGTLPYSKMIPATFFDREALRFHIQDYKKRGNY